MKKVVLFILLVLFVTSSVFAQSAVDKFPEKPITLIIPFGAGGSHDAHARIIEHFAKKALRSEPYHSTKTWW